MAYSIDFRKAAIRFMDIGHTEKELLDIFGIYASNVSRWKKLLEKTGSLNPNYPQTRKRKIDINELNLAVERKPDAYLHELAKQFGCTKQSIDYALKKHKITRKKRRLPTQKNP